MENKRELVILKAEGFGGEKEMDAYLKKCTHELLVMTKPAWSGKSLKLPLSTGLSRFQSADRGS